MSDEQAVIPKHEYVYRRVHKSYYNPKVSKPIQRGAFRPTGDDEDGLSFYRANMVTAYEVANGIKDRPAENYIVVKLQVRDLNHLGLVVVSDERPPLPGHCITPELNTTSYKERNRKHHWTDVQIQLCGLAAGSIAYP